jgi:hypothetical protein
VLGPRCLRRDAGVSRHQRAVDALDLSRRLRRRALPPGTRLKISVAITGARKTWIFRTRRGQRPTARVIVR